MKRYILAAVAALTLSASPAVADRQPFPVVMTPCVQPCGTLVDIASIGYPPKKHPRVKHRPVHHAVPALPNTGA